MKQRPLGSDRLETQGSSPPNASKTQEALFGIALSDEGTHLTKTQAAGIGTAYYIAPEQLEGSHHLTAAVDVYALGILLYNLLTGRIYQAHAPSISEGFKTLMMERRIEQAEKHRDIDWNASLHLLDTAFEKAVAFDSKQRPSLSAFLGSIREAKEMFQKKRKKCSERLWLAARSKLSEQPASEVFAEFRKNVLPAFPERTDFLSWLEVWHEAEKLATALQEEPVSPVQTLRADWKKAKKKSACPFVYDEHPFATNVLGLSASPRPQVSFESLENEEIPEIPPSRLPKPRVSRPPKRTLPNHFSDVPFTNIPSVGVPARNPPKFVQDLLQLRSPFFEIAATIACVLMVLGWAVFLFLLFFLSGPLTPVAWGSILGSLLIGGFSTWAFYRLAV